MKNNNSLLEIECENGNIKVIRHRNSLNEPFQEIKFCSMDSDGLPYEYTIFDMVEIDKIINL